MTPRALLLGVLLLSLPALGAVSSFGPEVPLSPASIVPSNTIQTNVAIATNGDGFLAAWFDGRDQQGTYATRIDVDGHVLDQPSFLVAPEQGAVGEAGIGRDTIVAISQCGAIDLFRVDENRNVSAPTRVTTQTSVCWGSVSVATNGETIVAAFGGNIAVLDAGLKLTKQFTIDPLASYGAVASNGRDYVVVSASQSPVANSTHLDANGAIVSTQQIFYPNNINSLAIASNGNDYLTLTGGPILGAQRLDANGGATEGGKMVHVASSPRPVTTPKIAWDGNEYIATYVQAPFISSSQLAAVVRVNANADVLNEQSLGGAREANVAFRSGRAAVVSLQSSATLQMFAPDNLTALTLPVKISTATPHQSTPKIVDANGTLAYFWIERGNIFQLKAKIGGGDEKVLADSVLGNFSVGFDGTRYVVVWSNAVAIFVQRFERDLTPFDPNPVGIAPSTPFASPVAAIADGRALIAWPQAEESLYAIKAMVVDTTTATMTFPQPVTLSSPPLSNGNPAVAWNGHEFSVVWPHDLSVPFNGLFNPPDEILAGHVSRDGAILDDTFVVARPGTSVTWLGAAGDYVAWITGSMAFGKLIRPAGDAQPLGPSVANAGLNVATYRGGYVVAWPAPGSTASTYSPALRLVDANGTPLTMYALSEVPHSFLVNDVDFESGVIVYMRTGIEAQYGGMSRLFARTFDPVPPKRRGASH